MSTEIFLQLMGTHTNKTGLSGVVSELLAGANCPKLVQSKVLAWQTQGDHG
jgi:hypothetical protein